MIAIPTTSERIIARKDGAIGWLVFNNPAKHNAISMDMMGAIFLTGAGLPKNPATTTRIKKNTAAARKGARITGCASMPRIRSSTIALIAKELTAGRDLVAPAYKGQRGHPVGLGKRFGAQLAALGGDAGARDIVAANQSELLLIECDDPGVLHDIDRREDLAPPAAGDRA